MPCTDACLLIGTYADGELDLIKSLEIEQHLQNCRACADELANHRAAFRAPGGLDALRSAAEDAQSDHTVKPWFDGKLDFSPPVEDLAGQGFPLMDGRLDYLDGRPVAALVYRHRQHLINLFIWPSAHASIGGESLLSQQGYNVVHWTQSGIAYWVVSNLNAEELRKFAQLIEAGAAPAPS